MIHLIRISILLIIALFLHTYLVLAQHVELQHISSLLNEPPKSTVLEIEYHEIVGLLGHVQWHISNTPYWIRLHPVENYDIEKLNKEMKYKVIGVVLEQNYGVVEVWVRE